ncbi:MAG: hypothetical protein DRH15_00490 [Deltaproteobacteria bacterium]|nr:MAG: hypothetical protein DRH15_00490 [Deltaproteobacteria bacterium]
MKGCDFPCNIRAHREARMGIASEGDEGPCDMPRLLISFTIFLTMPMRSVNTPTMNSLDIIIICVMIFFIVRGIFRGILKEIMSLVGVIGGIWLANRFQPALTIQLRHFMPGIPLLPLVSFIIILVGVMIAASILGAILKSLSQKGPMGIIDRLFGAGLATAKALIITYLSIVLLTFFLPAKTPLIAKSRLAPVIVSSYQSMVSLISPDFYKKWKEKLTRRDQAPGQVRKPMPPASKQKNGR